MSKKTFLMIAIVFLIALVPSTNAAATGKITLGPGISADNELAVGEDESPTIVFKNDAVAAITDVASTLQYLNVSVAVRNPTKVSVDLSAMMNIYDASNVLRATFTPVPGVKETSLFVLPGPVVPPETVDLYSWGLGPPSNSLNAYTDSSQFTNDLRILRPGENLTLTITVTCLEAGESIAWFFFGATKDAYASGSYPTIITTITDKTNIYYSKLPGPDKTKYWLPLHNSYDPYDSDTSSGHSFEMNSWTRNPTNTAYAKTNKVFHQTPPADGVSTDYGDAPDPSYPTLLASDGASHEIGNIWMGNIVDGEDDGQPTDQDDTQGADDEDGVSFPGAPWMVGGTGTGMITVSGDFEDGQTGYLHGWFDWNQDGDWDDPGENVFTGYPVSGPGTYVINFAVPADALPGSTWARFRLHDQNLNLVTGRAGNGEVEDYLVDPAIREEQPPTRRNYPVGGITTPVNKLLVIAPYLTLIGAITAVSTYIMKKKKI